MTICIANLSLTVITINILFKDLCLTPFSVPVAQWLEHCVSSAKVVGSIPREHILTKKHV